MVRLHLVGFTTDLKHLIFADKRGAASGGFVVGLDSRLRRTLEEVARLEEEADRELEPEVPDAPHEDALEAPKAPRVDSKLTPKQIQSLLRQGKSEEQVARLAQTGVEWIKRFSFAILAERRDVIDAVRSATLAKPRLGPSGMNIGEAVDENLGARRLRMGPEAMDAAWRAVRKNGRWHVSFEYQSRGQKRLARYSYDPTTRQVEPLNDIALELGWRAESGAGAAGSSVRAAPGSRVQPNSRPVAARSSGSPASFGVAASPKPSASGRTAATPRQVSTAKGTGRVRTGVAPKPGSGIPVPPVRKGSGAIRPAEPVQEPVAQQPPPAEPVSKWRPPEEEDLEAGVQDTAQPPSEDEDDAEQREDGFIIRRPRKQRGEYSTLPTVWKPSRRV